MVYRLYFKAADRLEEGLFRGSGVIRFESDLLRTCKQIHHEALIEFRRQNVFVRIGVDMATLQHLVADWCEATKQTDPKGAWEFQGHLIHPCIRATLLNYLCPAESYGCHLYRTTGLMSAQKVFIGSADDVHSLSGPSAMAMSGEKIFIHEDAFTIQPIVPVVAVTHPKKFRHHHSHLELGKGGRSRSHFVIMLDDLPRLSRWCVLLGQCSKPLHNHSVGLNLELNNPYLDAVVPLDIQRQLVSPFKEIKTKTLRRVKFVGFTESATQGVCWPTSEFQEPVTGYPTR